MWFPKISIPPPPTEGTRNSGGGEGVKGPGISGVGGGGASIKLIFHRPVSVFTQLYIKLRSLHFASPVANAKKIKPSNLKHKMSIFALVRLNVISRLESYHFPKLWLVMIEAHVLKSS